VFQPPLFLPKETVTPREPLSLPSPRRTGRGFSSRAYSAP